MRERVPFLLLLTLLPASVALVASQCRDSGTKPRPLGAFVATPATPIVLAPPTVSALLTSDAGVGAESLVSVAANGLTSAGIVVSGTWTGSLALVATSDHQTWFSVSATPEDGDGGAVATLGSDGTWIVATAGQPWQQVGVSAAGITSGAASVTVVGAVGFGGSGSSAPGTPGANGATGATGATGPAGSNGTNGTNGATGATGPAGSNGATGATGSASSGGGGGAFVAAEVDWTGLPPASLQVYVQDVSTLGVGSTVFVNTLYCLVESIYPEGSAGNLVTLIVLSNTQFGGFAVNGAAVTALLTAQSIPVGTPIVNAPSGEWIEWGYANFQMQPLVGGTANTQFYCGGLSFFARNPSNTSAMALTEDGLQIKPIAATSYESADPVGGSLGGTAPGWVIPFTQLPTVVGPATPLRVTVRTSNTVTQTLVANFDAIVYAVEVNGYSAHNPATTGFVHKQTYNGSHGGQATLFEVMNAMGSTQSTWFPRLSYDSILTFTAGVEGSEMSVGMPSAQEGYLVSAMAGAAGAIYWRPAVSSGSTAASIFFGAERNGSTTAAMTITFLSVRIEYKL